MSHKIKEFSMADVAEDKEKAAEVQKEPSQKQIE